MAELKITQLPQTTSSTASDYLMVVQNAVNKRITLTSLLNTLNPSDNVRINSARSPISFSISTPNYADLFYVSGPNDAVGIGTNSPQGKLHVVGTLKIGSSATDGILVHADETILYSAASDSVQGLSWFKPLNAARDTSLLQVDTGVATAQFDLTNGTYGQYKLLNMTTFPVGAKSTIRVLTGVGFNRIDMTTAAQSVLLKCVNVNSVPKWVIVSNNGATVYTV